MAPPAARPDALKLVILRETVLRRNRVRDGIVYMQVSRGVADGATMPFRRTRDSSLVVTARSDQWPKSAAKADRGVAVVTIQKTVAGGNGAISKQSGCLP